MTTLKFNFNDKKNEVTVNRWQKYGKDRLYVQDSKKKYGFYDLETEEWNFDFSNISSGWEKAMKETVAKHAKTL